MDAPDSNPDARAPRSRFYDGGLYARIVEPMLDGVYGFVADRLPEGDRVLDACCGSGGLALQIAAQGRDVVGVDLSPSNVEYARTRADGPGAPTFEVGDVSQLSVPDAGRYDVATIVLALHEMPAAARRPVLQRLLEVAERVMVVDYATPMPWNRAGARDRFIELAAGWEHFCAFRDFSARGGVPALVADAGATVESERTLDAGTLHVAVLRRTT